MRQQRVWDFYQGWLPFSLCFTYDSPFLKTNQQPFKKKRDRESTIEFLGFFVFCTLKRMLTRQYAQLYYNNNNKMTMQTIKEAVMISGLTKFQAWRLPNPYLGVTTWFGL
ncbi:hypothetical protein RDI58_017008 [Solanum bulbocastanum]|uniref:Uncharacterized protein n=1 Tax=Solanum bulbocastanum TaxID=147425 RepID=A0AAN8T8Z5_SOLBU